MLCYIMPVGSAASHLAMEETLFHHLEEDLLLLWVNDPAVVCGKYQNIYQETNVYRAWKKNIPVLRRDSGGGTVYHDGGNINYSVMRSFEGTVDYDELLSEVSTALQRMGIPAIRRGVCDLTVEGKKISGNAQAIRNRRLLHHGTLLFSADLHALHEVSGREGREYISRATKSAPSEVRNLNEIWSGSVDAFIQALCHHWPKPLKPFTPEVDLFAEAEKCAREKYERREWNLSRCANFTCRVQGEWAGNPVNLSYVAKKGVIQSCDLQSCKLPKNAGAFLEGAPLFPEEVEEVCRTLCAEYAEDLAEFII